MMKKTAFRKENVLMYLFASLLVAAGGLAVFVKAFPAWNVVSYVLSMVLLAMPAGMIVYLVMKLKNRARPALKALLGGAGFLVCSFGAVFLVNNVILKETQAKTAALIVSVAFALFFVAGAAAVAFAAGKGTAFKIAAPLLALLLMGWGLYTAVAQVLPERYDHPYVEKIQKTEGLGMAAEQSRLIVNADDSHWWGFFNDLAKNGAFDDGSMNAYVTQYAETGVTDIMFNIFCQSSDVPSDVMTFRGDLYGQKTQNGAAVDYGSYYGLNAIYNEQKKDIFAVWFKKCEAAGIRPWISLRMNDCHDPDEETSQLRGDLFYTAREKGWMIGEEYGYFRNCLNYAVPEVRRLMLDYTREQLLKYDVYGLELDFMREIYCFDYLHADNAEIVEIMNGYIRDTAAIVKEAQTKHGHDIKLSVRLARDIDQCKVFGFDAGAWCAEGLVDAVTVTPRFSTNDSMMPIAEWKAKLSGVEVWAGVETLVNRQAEGSAASPEVVRGYAAQYLTAGADGVYLFNYMSAGTVNARNGEVYNTCGSLEQILTLPRRHIVTWQDTAPKGWEPYRPLPLKLKRGKTAALAVETGYIPDGSAVCIYIGVNQPLDGEQLLLTADGRACGFGGKSEISGWSETTGGPVPGGYCEDGTYIYKYTLADTVKLPNLIGLSLANKGAAVTLTYAEIDVTPGQS